jgi:multidrug efflux pump subunit AcrB
MIKIDPKKLKKYNLTLNKLINIIRASNKDLPIGFIKSKDGFLTLSFYGEKDDVKKLKESFILPNVKLKDVADVKWIYQTNNSGYIGNNKPSIAISVQRAPGGSVLDTAKAARKIIKEIAKEYPNIEFQISDTQVELVKTANENMLDALRDAIIYTLLVLLLFLGNFKAIIAAGISIPLVFFGTIAFIYLTGGGLNIVIYTGIILALGMLTDNAVVVLENIERHLEEKENLKDAIYSGTKEVINAVFGGTIATIAITFPLMFVGGFPQKIFRPLIETLIVALLISYFLSITFIPKLMQVLYKNGLSKTKVEKFFEMLYQKTIAKLMIPYLGIIKFSNGKFYPLRRILIIAAAMITLMLSLKNVMPTIGRDVMPPMDTGIMKASLEFSNNINADEAKKRLAPFFAWLDKQPWLERSSVSIGTEKGVLSLGGGGAGNSVSMTITAVNRFERKKTLWQLENEVREHLANIQGVKKLAVFDFGATALSTIKAPLDIEIRDENYEHLPDIAHKVEKLLYNIKGLTTIKTSWDKDFEEAVIKIDKNKALSYGITPLQVISQIALNDKVVTINSDLSSMNVQFVRIRFNKKYENPESLKYILINTPKGVIPLKEIAEIKPNFTYNKITRDGLLYSIDVEGYRATRPVSKITADADNLLHKSGIINYDQAGDISEMKDSFKRMIKAIAIGIIVLILTLSVFYESFRLAFIMIIVLPLSMIGAAWGMLIMHKPSCMPSMVGILLLFGIIIKNAVLLIDFYKEYKREGNSPYDAAYQAIKVRYRPVMMTAFGTIAGMIPIALEQAVGLERLSPLADVAIGGLLIGTLLTLVYVPMLAYATDPDNKKTNIFEKMKEELEK